MIVSTVPFCSRVNRETTSVFFACHIIHYAYNIYTYLHSDVASRQRCILNYVLEVPLNQGTIRVLNDKLKNVFWQHLRDKSLSCSIDQ